MDSQQECCRPRQAPHRSAEKPTSLRYREKHPANFATQKICAAHKAPHAVLLFLLACPRSTDCVDTLLTSPIGETCHLERASLSKPTTNRTSTRTYQLRQYPQHELNSLNIATLERDHHHISSTPTASTKQTKTTMVAPARQTSSACLPDDETCFFLSVSTS